MFEKFNIISESDMRLAAEPQEAYLEDTSASATRTIVDFPAKREDVAADGSR